MKSLRKIGALLLAGVMALSLCTVAFAANSEDGSPDSTGDKIVGTADDSGNITVEGVKIENDSDDAVAPTVTAYPIVLACYDENGNFAGYVSLYDALDLDQCVQVYGVDDQGNRTALMTEPGSLSAARQAVAEDGKNEETSYTGYVYVYEYSEKILDKILGEIVSATDYEETYKKLVEAVLETLPEGYTLGDAAAASYVLTADEVKEGDTTYTYTYVPTDDTAALMAIGSYLVVVSGSDAVSYNVAVASTYYANKDGTGNSIEAGDVDMTGAGITYGDVWMKSDEPEIHKVILNPNTDTGEDNKSKSGTGENVTARGSSYNVGDVVQFQFVVSNVPGYDNYEYTEIYYQITDTLEHMTLVTEVTGQDSWLTVTGQKYGNTDDSGANLTETLTQITENNKSDYTNLVTDGELNVEACEKLLNGCYTLTVDEDSHGFTVNFVIQIDKTTGAVLLPGDESYDGENVYYYYTLDDMENGSLTFTYGATLDDDAAVNAVGNENDVALTYSHDPTDYTKTKTKDSKTYQYTFDIDGTGYPYADEGSSNIHLSETWRVLTKVGESAYQREDDTTQEWVNDYALAGAEFSLYTDVGCTTKYTNGSEENGFDGTVTTGDQGEFAISGLAAGTYYLKETKAPDGYALNNTVYRIVISTVLDDDGVLRSWEIVTSACVDPDENTTEEEWTAVGDSKFTVDYGEVAVDAGSTSAYTDADFLNDLYQLETESEKFAAVPGESNTYRRTYTGTDSKTLTVTAVKTEVDNSTAVWNVVTTAKDDDDQDYVVSEDVLYVTVETDDDGNMTYTVTTVTAEVGEAEIRNTSTPELPNTGGLGTALFTIIGCCIILCAVALLAAVRRRNNRRSAA